MIAFEYLAFVQSPGSSALTAGSVVDEWLFADTSPAGAAEYALVSYAPAVAPTRRSRLGGSGAVAEVDDVITVHCLGGTATQAVAAYERLVAALDAAERWANEEQTDVIQVRMRVLGGTVGELAATVLGPSEGGPVAQAAPQWDQAIGAFVIRNVTLRFRRRGLLLAPAADAPVTSPTATTGEIMTCTLPASHPVLSPARVDVLGVDASDSASGYLLVAGTAAQLQIVNLASYVNNLSGTSTVAESAGNYSRSGTIRRFTAASAATVMTVGGTISIPSRCATAHVFVNARPGSAAAAWSLRIRHTDNGGLVTDDVVSSLGARVPVPQNATVNLVYLGTIARVEQWNTIILEAFVTAPSYPQTLDIDTLVLLAEDDTTTIVYAAGMSVTSTITTFTLDPRPLVGVGPRGTRRLAANDGFSAPLRETGDSYTQQRGNVLAGLAYLNVPGTTRWRPGNVGPSGPATLQLKAARWKGYRVPQ